jgi:DNA-directed RNA polymerase specialized sigma24 family protein
MIPLAGLVVGTLPRAQQDVLALVCGADYSYGKAAEALGLPVEQVRRHLLQARLALIAGLPHDLDA